jgi:hypothetical protein
MDYQDAVVRYLRALQELGRSPKTRKNHQLLLGVYRQWLERAQLDWRQVTRPQFSNHIATFARWHTRAHTRGYRCVLTAFYAFSVRYQWVEQSPVTPRPSPRPTRAGDLPVARATLGIDPALAQAIARFYARLLVRGYSERTARNYEYLLVRFGRHRLRRRLRFTEVTADVWRPTSTSTGASASARPGPARPTPAPAAPPPWR